MTVLTIRDVPDEVRDTLAREAKARGQSLQAYLLGILKRQADVCYNRAVIVEIEGDLHAQRRHVVAEDAVEALRAVRAERERRVDDW